MIKDKIRNENLEKNNIHSHQIEILRKDVSNNSSSGSLETCPKKRRSKTQNEKKIQIEECKPFHLRNDYESSIQSEIETEDICKYYQDFKRKFFIEKEKMKVSNQKDHKNISTPLKMNNSRTKDRDIQKINYTTSYSGEIIDIKKQRLKEINELQA